MILAHKDVFQPEEAAAVISFFVCVTIVALAALYLWRPRP